MRKQLWNILAVLVLLSLALAACSPAAPAQPAAPTTAPAAEAEPTAAPAAEAEGSDFKVAFVYVAPIGDLGWTWAQDQGRLAVEQELGVETAYIENVPEGPDAGASSAISRRRATT